MLYKNYTLSYQFLVNHIDFKIAIFWAFGLKMIGFI